MNINFRKLDLPPIPYLEATALIELVRTNGDNRLQFPQSPPTGVPNLPIVSRSNLDEIIRDIENGQTGKITILEWLYCLQNKEKWDIRHPNRIRPTSEAIWQAAERHSWLKQRLFWNLALNLSGEEVLTPSLAKSHSVFSPQDWLDRGRLAIIKALQARDSTVQLMQLCWKQLLTPSELLVKYQFPTKIPIVRQSLCLVVPQFSQITTPSRQPVQWLLKCLNQMSSEQQVKAVESLLTQVSQKIGADHPELFDWLHQHYGSSIANSRWNELSSEAKAAMRKWIGAVSYQDFRKLVKLIIERLSLEEWEERRLKSRSNFWSNYSDRFERIRILLPQTSVEILGDHLNHQDVGILIADGSDPTEICIFDFGDWFVVEFFRGDGSETSIIRKEPAIEQQLFHSQLSVKLLRCLDRDIHDHEFCWQHFCEQLLRTKNIFPNENVHYFDGLSNKNGKYNRQTGLPEPSLTELQDRVYKVERWEQKMARLERKAREYSSSATLRDLLFGK